jgi:D-arabinitol 2-dehydrogenase
VKATFERIKAEYGRVDVSIRMRGTDQKACVTAAGIVENFVAHEYPTDKIRKLLDINVMGMHEMERC